MISITRIINLSIEKKEKKGAFPSLSLNHFIKNIFLKRQFDRECDIIRNIKHLENKRTVVFFFFFCTEGRKKRAEGNIILVARLLFFDICYLGFKP